MACYVQLWEGQRKLGAAKLLCKTEGRSVKVDVSVSTFYSRNPKGGMYSGTLSGEFKTGCADGRSRHIFCATGQALVVRDLGMWDTAKSHASGPTPTHMYLHDHRRHGPPNKNGRSGIGVPLASQLLSSTNQDKFSFMVCVCVCCLRLQVSGWLKGNERENNSLPLCAHL